MPTAAATKTIPQTTQNIEAKPNAFRSDFNKKSFQFSHNLVGHRLFSLPRLAELAKTLLADTTTRSVRWQAGGAPVDAGWAVPLNEKVESVNEAISNLAESGSWVLLYSVQRDPEYRALLDQLMSEILSDTGCRREDVTWEDAYIFLASPNAVTPYHIDHEATFLFQVHGNRTANIWDANDRSVLQEKEIEKYYAGDLNAAKYTVEKQAKATVYALNQGTGVHHPSKAPHAFKNGDIYSIALGIHFCVRECDQQAATYQMNYLLRRVGLKPTPPGKSAWRDKLKMSIIGMFADKNPKTKHDMLRSGFKKLTIPLRAVMK
ncbi:MAG: hypothetical protein KGI75_06340 [Rhizobiaceae bacterium]|nr:hypothetical protein [Rhizobiaceae bacterium]